MIIWLNGTFGAGKTTAAGKLAELLPQARFFDTEQVGGMLATVPDLPELGDFQHWPPWRHLVVETASQLLDYVGGILVVPQTVLVKQYWDEISTGLAEAGITVHHYVLHTDRDTLSRRLLGDRPAGNDWRLGHLSDYEKALPWLRDAARVVDTTDRAPKEIARAIAEDSGALR